MMLETGSLTTGLLAQMAGSHFMIHLVSFVIVIHRLIDLSVFLLICSVTYSAAVYVR